MRYGSIHLLLATSLVYLALATGTLLPKVLGDIVIVHHTVIAGIAILVLMAKSNLATFGAAAIIVISPIIAVLIFRGMVAHDIPFLIEKVDGAVLSTIFVSSISAHLITKFGEERFFQAFVFVAMFVLAATLAYKAVFGFSVRSVRYLINGPIVFGWLMALSSLTSVYLMLQGRFLANGTRAALFLAATFWAMSKGPIVAFALAAPLLVFRLFSFKRAVLVSLCMVSLGYVVIWSLPSEFLVRYEAIFRVLADDAGTQDFGSIGARQHMMADALELYRENPLLGVGVTNFQVATSGGFAYPHNLTLEIMSEMGVIGLVAFGLVFAFVLWKNTPFGRAVFLFIFICTSFSGDMSYLRILLFIPLTYTLLLVSPTSVRNPAEEPGRDLA
ncbi:O-antigen ligase family protein [Roseovarius sp. SCSIO 43702]|uniref:O-antigen ligase family protein n=1 Tax=Roseovarius sp. SCSIO 43702 TaxID=2823043 RepID=UPI001C73AF56|nr:O-antigen ligase family protein [Roseovarius sp. SCSIO 43702]QYX56778.1 O-antigen ligase family protein [Roseovarius sp. SCSIO 43702]